jgi:hypothetical protein
LSFIPNPFGVIISDPLKNDDVLMNEITNVNPPPQKFIDFDNQTYLITGNTGVSVFIFLIGVLMYLVAKAFSMFDLYLKVTMKIVRALEWNPMLLLINSQFMELVVYSTLNLRYTTLATFNSMLLFFNFSLSIFVIVITSASLVSVF